MWQQLELASELESDLRDTMDFFICHLAAPQSTLGNCSGVSLTHSMLNTGFDVTWPEGHWELCHEVGS